MPWPEPVTLRGHHATLEPLTKAHLSELIEAVKDGELWRLWYTSVPAPDAMAAEIDRRLMLQAKGSILDCIAVEFRTGSFNHQSRRAIERLGARLDGILRSHQRYGDGSVRDTYVYSIIAAEWPAARTHLKFQLERSRD
jgi:hypothetical protein